MTATAHCAAYVACVPHVPLLSLQQKAQNQGMWDAYDARITEFEAFDPELVIVYGGDHYSNIHLDLAPAFLLGHKAQAINDCGGTPGALDVPMAQSTRLAETLTQNGFDIAISYAMRVDHGFSNVLGLFLKGKLDARPVIPIHINTLTDPRPTFKRCRELGQAVGAWAAGLGKRVAVLGSGGLSHQTDFIFPQYHTAPNEDVRTFIVHGGEAGKITDEQWHADIQSGMNKLSGDLVSGAFKAPWINKVWDTCFLDAISSGRLDALDAWTDAEVLKAAGYGGSEIRTWIAALATGSAAGAGKVNVDFYSDTTTLAVGVGVAHARTEGAS